MPTIQRLNTTDPDFWPRLEALTAWDSVADEAVTATVREILAHAITRGGTTLRDFLQPDGEPGYFEQELFVYGRAGEACKACGHTLRAADWGQRATAYCPRCQR